MVKAVTRSCSVYSFSDIRVVSGHDFFPLAGKHWLVDTHGLCFVLFCLYDIPGFIGINMQWCLHINNRSDYQLFIQGPANITDKGAVLSACCCMCYLLEQLIEQYNRLLDVK